MSIRGGNITANDLTLVEIVSGYRTKKQPILTKEDLSFQEERRQRKFKRLDFEIK